MKSSTVTQFSSLSQASPVDYLPADTSNTAAAFFFAWKQGVLVLMEN